MMSMSGSVRARPITTVAFALFLCTSAGAQTVSVTVNAGEALKPISSWLYGINTARWDESLFPAPTVDMLLAADRDAIRKIKASGITLLKYPGGNDADHYVWNSKSNNSTEMDTDEYIALCRAVGAEPFITVNFNEPPALAAEWVRYCNVTRGYNVKLWEVGDEQWGTWARGHAPPEEYAKKYISFVKAMREVDPGIKVATNVPLGSHPENWAERVLKAAGEHVDMLTYTYFPQQWGKENDDTLMATVATFRRLVTRLQADVERAVGRERAASILFVNVGFNSVNHSPGPQTLQMINALWTADMLGTMARLGTDIACFWALHNFYPPRGGDFGYMSSDGKNTPYYSYFVFPLLARHLSGTLVEARTQEPTLSVYASRRAKTLSVVLINKERKKDRRLEIRLQEIETHTSAAVWLLDEKHTNDRKHNLTGESGLFATTLPPSSITAIEFIQRDSLIPPLNLASSAVATASSYSTIGPHFKPPSAIDGISGTRWNSAAWTKSSGNEKGWFQLVWKTPKQIRRVRIDWGETHAVEYLLRASSDGKKWTTIRTVTNGTGGTEEHTLSRLKARYLRIEGTRGTKGISAYSIREIGVYEE